MKIWQQHGSEHSANLVMIGHFKDAAEATRAEEIISMLRQQVEIDQSNGTPIEYSSSGRYSKDMLDLLKKLDLWSIGPSELDQLNYDVGVEAQANKVIIKTDETEISVFLKVLFDRGARIEVFSAHTHPEIKY